MADDGVGAHAQHKYQKHVRCPALHEDVLVGRLWHPPNRAPPRREVVTAEVRGWIWPRQYGQKSNGGSSSGPKLDRMRRVRGFVLRLSLSFGIRSGSQAGALPRKAEPHRRTASAAACTGNAYDGYLLVPGSVRSAHGHCV